jgi:biopolymer transport protein ExbD
MKEITSRKNRTRVASLALSARPLKLWQDDNNNQEVRIEIVPLIDVIFCILTFFLLAAVGFSRQQAISLDLPKASTGKPQMREMLVVSLDDLGQTYVEKQSVTKTQLYQAIKNYHQINPKGLMVLNASRNSSYDEVIEVLDMLRQVGGDRVALATLPGQEKTPDNLNTYPNTNLQPSMQPLPGNSYNPSGVPSYPNQGEANSQFYPYQTNPNLPSSNPNLPGTNLPGTNPNPNLPGGNGVNLP